MAKNNGSQIVRGLLMRKVLLWAFGAGLPIIGIVLIILVVAGVIANLASQFWYSMYVGYDPHKSLVQQQSAGAHIEQTFKTVADEWKQGLDAQQQEIVSKYQLDMPYSVLLSMGKFVDNFQSPDLQQEAQRYYDVLKPQYQWVKGEGTTVTKDKFTTSTKNRRSKGTTKTTINTTTTHFTVWELVKATTWDATFTSSWTTETTGQFVDGIGTETTQPVMKSYNLKYAHARYKAVAKQYKLNAGPLFYETIFMTQYHLYQNGDSTAYLNDPLVAKWGSLFGQDTVYMSTPQPGKMQTVSNPQQIKAWVAQAITLDAPDGVTSDWEQWMMLLIGHENSTGDPNAVNPEAVEYYQNPPSYEHASGLLQMCPSTFQEYAVPGHTDIFNPVDNIAASMRNILSAYGNPSKIPGITAWYNGPGGYGGYM